MFGIKKKTKAERVLDTVGDALESLNPLAVGAAIAAIAAAAIGASAVANEIRDDS